MLLHCTTLKVKVSVGPAAIMILRLDSTTRFSLTLNHHAIHEKLETYMDESKYSVLEYYTH